MYLFIYCIKFNENKLVLERKGIFRRGIEVDEEMSMDRRT